MRYSCIELHVMYTCVAIPTMRSRALFVRRAPWNVYLCGYPYCVNPWVLRASSSMECIRAWLALRCEAVRYLCVELHVLYTRVASPTMRSRALLVRRDPWNVYVCSYPYCVKPWVICASSSMYCIRAWLALRYEAVRYSCVELHGMYTCVASPTV